MFQNTSLSIKYNSFRGAPTTKYIFEKYMIFLCFFIWVLKNIKKTSPLDEGPIFQKNIVPQKLFKVYIAQKYKFSVIFQALFCPISFGTV